MGGVNQDPRSSQALFSRHFFSFQSAGSSRCPVGIRQRINTKLQASISRRNPPPGRRVLLTEGRAALRPSEGCKKVSLVSHRPPARPVSDAISGHASHLRHHRREALSLWGQFLILSISCGTASADIADGSASREFPSPSAPRSILRSSWSPLASAPPMPPWPGLPCVWF